MQAQAPKKSYLCWCLEHREENKWMLILSSVARQTLTQMIYPLEDWKAAHAQP